MASPTGSSSPTSAAHVVGRRPAPFVLGIRSQLLLVLTVFLAIPWLGYVYVQELERFLRESQERTLAGTAQAVATALHDRPALFQRRDVVPASEQGVPEIDEILQALSRTTARIFVVDRDANVLARAGSLRRPVVPESQPATGIELVASWIDRYTLHPLYALLLKQPTEDFSDDFLGRPVPFAREVDGALAGILTTDRRSSRDGRVTIVAAAHPIWLGDRVQGAVVVEETTNAVLAERNRAFERLFTLVLAVTLIGAAALTIFASRLSGRIRRLRDEVDQAIDAKGRVRHITAGSDARDEIGDLSRSFSSVLARLADSATHREELASRLSHELRTPIAVVRSSLENLHGGGGVADEARVYLERAQGGLDRLSQILTRMSEATRLEQSVHDADLERFDVVALVGACVDGYRTAYAPREFILDAADAAIPIRGAPDLVAQMLDKLAANAIEFGIPERPVVVRVERAGGDARLSVSNDGPLLPEGMRDRLFESMVSVRPESSRATPHLGLGLYIVRLVVELHRGSVRADNRADGSGVVVTVTLPLATD